MNSKAVKIIMKTVWIISIIAGVIVLAGAILSGEILSGLLMAAAAVILPVFFVRVILSVFIGVFGRKKENQNNFENPENLETIENIENIEAEEEFK